MKTSVTLTFDDHLLKDVKKRLTGKSLSSFTNSLYNDWLEARKRDELIAAYKRVSKDRFYKEFAELTEGSLDEDWSSIDEMERKQTS